MPDNPKNPLPGSKRPLSSAEMRQVSEKAMEIGADDLRTIDSDDFRVTITNPEAVSRFERLREAVEKAGGNKVVAARSGVPISSLGAYKQGKREWPFPAVVALAEVCEVSLDWLATGRSQSPGKALPTLATTPVSDDMTHYISIPRYNVRVAAGRGHEVSGEELIGYLAMDETFLRQNLGHRREDLVSIQAEGDSMDPTIRDGDLLIVDKTVTEIRSSRIYVLSVNDLLIVKRIQMQVDGTVVIKSDNPKYAAEFIRPNEINALRIIGQVVYQAGPVRS